MKPDRIQKALSVRDRSKREVFGLCRIKKPGLPVPALRGGGIVADVLSQRSGIVRWREGFLHAGLLSIGPLRGRRPQ
jgi:hypothetical protein